jgi:hypothetical protein
MKDAQKLCDALYAEFLKRHPDWEEQLSLHAILYGQMPAVRMWWDEKENEVRAEIVLKRRE